MASREGARQKKCDIGIGDEKCNFAGCFILFKWFHNEQNCQCIQLGVCFLQ